MLIYYKTAFPKFQYKKYFEVYNFHLLPYTEFIIYAFLTQCPFPCAADASVIKYLKA